MNQRPPQTDYSRARAPLTRAERVDLLFREISRISDPFHKAIDNYYKILPFAVTVIGVAVGLVAKGGAPQYFALVPFMVLAIVLVESQIRTTIMCSAKYLCIMERRVSHEAGFKALLYERSLSLGNFIYYKPLPMFFYKAIGFLPFAVILTILYWFSTAKFMDYILDSKSSARIREVSHCDPKWLAYGYEGILTLTTVWTIISWLALFHFAAIKYERILETILEDENISLAPKESAKKSVSSASKKPQA